MNVHKLDGFNKIYEVECFQEEFEKTVSETKPNGRYHKWLRTKLMQLDELGHLALKLRDFEPIKDTDPRLYAIRYPRSQKNPRVVYVYIENDKICLLHTFNEKSTSDYNSAIKIAQNRTKSL